MYSASHLSKTVSWYSLAFRRDAVWVCLGMFRTPHDLMLLVEDWRVSAREWRFDDGGRMAADEKCE